MDNTYHSVMLKSFTGKKTASLKNQKDQYLTQ